MKHWLTVFPVVFSMCGLAASFVVLALHSRIARDAFVRLLSVWRSLTVFGRVAVCSFLMIGVLIGGDKTNGVFQTGLTGLTGLSGVFPRVPLSQNSVNPVDPVYTTSDDVARGWRVESVIINAAVSYAMPSNGTLVGNWHVHGAKSSFGNNRIDFGDWSFPIGTNGTALSSFWYFVDGRIRPMPKDAAHEICAVGVPMSAVPGRSRLWTAEEPDGSRVLTWDNFFLGGDTNAPVNAQIRLYHNGDFTTRSNDVETVCRRVNPDDWDDDGIPNDSDLNPLVCDGDFFGPANILPDGANINAYCTVSLVATGPDTLVVFEGDGPSDYPDPRFIAKHGVTNEVLILIGKTYTVSSDWPIEFAGASDPETEMFAPLMRLRSSRPLRGETPQTHTVRRPVSISASDGNPFTMSVVPSNLGGVFSWNASNCGCSISGGGNTFSWNCSMSCTCCETYADGWYSYEGYRLPATSCMCGCQSNGEPEWTDAPGPLQPSVSVSFSKAAVIFEDAYENEPGQWVGKRSTRTRLNIVANGGPNGGMLAVTSTNLARLERISGPDLPLAPVTVPPETQVTYSIVYEGAEASDAEDDITVHASFQENATSCACVSSGTLTVVRIELEAEDTPPGPAGVHRHVFGVDETVLTHVYPDEAVVSWQCADCINVCLNGRDFFCPWNGGTFAPSISCGSTQLPISIQVVEPRVVCSGAEWNSTVTGAAGAAGCVAMKLHLYIEPRTVSFFGVYMEEVPDAVEGSHQGYFDDLERGGPLSHTAMAGAGNWEPVRRGGYWTTDHVQAGQYSPPWTDGWKIWRIPVGWGQIGNLKGTIDPDPTSQRFEITESGTVSVRKYQHEIRRTTTDKVWLDGVRQK